MERRDVTTRRALRAALASKVALAASKVAVGVTVHSPALLADGINSATDVAYTIAARHFVVRASEPPDDRHPYGHGQLEGIATLTVGAFVMATAIALFVGGFNDVIQILIGQHEVSDTSLVALGVAAVTVALKLVLWLVTAAQARSVDSLIVSALARDHRNDIWSAGAAGVGILASRAGVGWGDPAAAIAVSAIIFKTGLDVLREAADDLMDTRPSDDRLAATTAIAKGVDGVEAVEITGMHRYGRRFVLTVTVHVDGVLTVAAGHTIADAVEGRLLSELDGLASVDVHVEPS